MSEAQHFTAAQIAEALGKHPYVVRRWLSAVKPDCEMIVRGNAAGAWEVESLPAHCLQELEGAKKAQGYRTIEDLLSRRASEPSPQIPWREVCPQQQTEALALRRALLPLIERRHDTTLSVAEFEALGVQTYQRETGEEISPERWRYLFDRTIKRDDGAEQFQRPEIYLNGNLRRATVKAPARSDLEEFKALGECIARFRARENPSCDDVDGLWMEILEFYRELAETQNPKKLKRRLIDYLFAQAPFLSKNRNALRSLFDGKLSGRIRLLDGRREKRGEKTAPEIPQADIDTAAAYVLRNCGDRTTQGIRELAARGARSGLSAPTLDLLARPAKSKSHVNRRFFDAVNHDVKLAAPLVLGKKSNDDATPSIHRDYSKLHTMDVLTADDFTMPVYMFVSDGKGWWTLTRGQCLLMIDVRSLKIIAFSLQPERSYNSLVIRTLMNQACRAWGLPRVWYFENGIWRNALLVKGASREWSEGKSWGELKPGWERLGVKFIHAKKARSKPAELVGGLLQNLMERIPGYCGRDERRDCPEETRRNKLAVEARRVEPHGLFLSFDAWYQELEKLVNAYNNTVQQGRILNGLSPEQAFEAHWNHGNEPVKFDASCWHLLAHYVSQRTVGVEGITFTLNGKPYVYRDENSSDLRGRDVLAWFDPECPELLGVTDLKGRDPRLIQRANGVDFLACMDPSSSDGKQFADELAKVAGHNAYPKARYKVLYSKFNPTWRENRDVALNTALVATTFSNGRAAIEEKQKRKAERSGRRFNKALKLGLQPSSVRSGGELVDDGLELMDKAERAEKQAAKTYTLNPHKTFKPKKGNSDVNP